MPETREHPIKLPCGDIELYKLCLEYADILKCCGVVALRRSARFRNWGKLLWGRADILDLFALKKDLLKLGYFTFKVTSWCMFPVLQKGDLLKIEAVDWPDVKIGDIPVYRSGNHLYAHRIVDRKNIDGEKYIITRPDSSSAISNSKSEEMVPEEEMLGIARGIKRGGETLSTEKRKPNGWDKFSYLKIMTFTRIINFLPGILIKVQSLELYKLLARIIAKRIMQHCNFKVAMLANTKLKIYREVPLKKTSIPELTEHRVFHVLMRFKNDPIGCLTVIKRDSNDCLYRGFCLSTAYVRLRYRGMGFERVLANTTKEFLKSMQLKNFADIPQ